MKPTIYLIGNNQEYIQSIEQSISCEARVHNVSKSDLMGEIYKLMPHCILIIADDLDSDGFSLVDSTISLEYIPTICISFRTRPALIRRYISHATYISGQQLNPTLSVLIEQAYQFTSKYHDMHICQDTYDVMNEEIRASLESYLNEDEIYDHKVLMNYLRLVYVDNIFLDNHPESMWIIKKVNGEKYIGNHYPVSYKVDYFEKAFEDSTFSFEPYKETGFFKNKTLDEFSDIEVIEELIPNALSEISGAINNIASFAIHDMMVIAINYNEQVRQRDLNILKALTIKMDLMMTIKDKMSALEASFDYTMNALARAAEGNDDVTGHHIRRVNYYSKLIARCLGMDTKFVKSITVAAQMHDVGKINTPDSVLNKPGKLTDQEFALMQAHTVQGQIIIGDSEDLEMAANIARSHHEKYDGTGYPDKLKGTAIPLEARIVFLADIYDALRSERPYKRGFTHEEAYEIIVNGDGRVEPTHFDPDILAIFIERHKAFEKIFATYSD